MVCVLDCYNFRTDLMLAEFKRDAARKELGQLEEDIEERKQRLQQLTDGELQNEEHQKATLQFKQKVGITNQWMMSQQIFTGM